METSAKRWHVSSLESLPSNLRSPEALETALTDLTDREGGLLLEDWSFWARDAQVPPRGDWRIWLYLGGRGAGKTRAGAEWVVEGVRTGRAKRVALIAATHSDARTVMIEGVSGLLTVSDGAEYDTSTRRVRWPGGGPELRRTRQGEHERGLVVRAQGLLRVGKDEAALRCCGGTISPRCQIRTCRST